MHLCSLARGEHFVGFADGSGQRLFDQQVDAVGEESKAHAVMKPSRSGDDGGVDAADQLAIVGEDGDADIVFGQTAGFGKRIGNADKLDAMNLLARRA